MQRKDDGVMVFDFLNQLESMSSSGGQHASIEQNLCSVLVNALGIKKLAGIKVYINSGIVIDYRTGYQDIELQSIKNYLTDNTCPELNDSFSQWDNTGMPEVYALKIVGDEFFYVIIASMETPPALSTQAVITSVVDALKTVVRSDSYNQPLIQQFNDLVLNNIVSGIIVIDKDSVVRFINHAAEMILGYRPVELIGQQCGMLFREIDRDQNWLSFTLTTGAQSMRTKIVMMRKDGIEIAVGGTASLLKNMAGEILGVIGIFREYEDYESDQRFKKELNKMSTLSKLSASIAHEIRNPLAGISATAQVLAGKFEADDRRQRFVTVILEEIDRINRIIKELLNFASPSKASFLQSNINKILEHALDLLHKKIQKQNIEVVREYDRDLPDILCDENQLKQAVVNIMMNSVGAMPEGGMITVVSERITVNSEDWIQIVIQDTGSGIPKEVLQELFTPFTTTKTQGLGLGLTITKNIIKTHRGKITAENIEGRGARVVVKLPVKIVPLDTEEQPFLPFE
ncbi:MAG: ATP-binding protein [Candidatus Auribacterota bacterium]